MFLLFHQFMLQSLLISLTVMVAVAVIVGFRRRARRLLRPKEPALEEVLDLPTLMENVNGSRELLRELVCMLEESLPERLERIHVAIAQGDTELLHREAHSLKGAVAGLRARKAYDIVCRFDVQARAANIDGARELERDMCNSLQELATRLRQECDRLQDLPQR